MVPIKLDDILEKREEIMSSNKKDEYIQVPGDDDNDEDDVSTSSFKVYQVKKQVEKYNLSKNMQELTDTVKFYLASERTRKINWAIGSYVFGFIGVSGLIVLNDYILINYIL